MIGDRDQFQLWGAFRSGPLPHVRLISSSPLEAEVAYDGVRHRRAVRLERDVLVVEDAIDGKGRTRIVLSLPVARGGSPTVEPLGGADLSVDEGWLAERMFVRDPIPVVRATAVRELPLQTGWRVGLGSSS
jgi:hypothetical protein